MNATVIGIITSVISATLSGILAIVMKNVNDDARNYRKKRQEDEEELKKIELLKQETEREALVAIMRTMLKENADRCFEKGFYTVEEREIYSSLYKVYKAYGGNGVIDEMGNRLRPLPYDQSEERIPHRRKTDKNEPAPAEGKKN